MGKRGTAPRNALSVVFLKLQTGKTSFPEKPIAIVLAVYKNSYVDIENAAGCDARLFWKLISRQRPWQNRMYPESVYEGITANTSYTVSNVFATYFADIYTLQSNDRY